MQRRAFTLIELLIIIAIIAILAAMVISHHVNKGTPVPTTTPKPKGMESTATPGGNYDVQLLFTISDMKVYRFSDAGHYVYIVDGRNSRASYNETISTGKATVYVPVEAQTVK